MGFINFAEKTINAKLVYYGVGMGGKTTSLQAVHSFMVARNEVQLVSIKTEGDATLLFDFLPINLGQVEGFKIRIQGYTVPGQPKYKLMRKYVLSGADGVVLVIDSERSRLEENLQSLASLKENLKANGLDPNTIPLVLQYNKRDLQDILSEEELDRHFKFRDDIAAFPSVARDGQGVFEAFTHAAGMLVEQRVRHYGLGRGSVEPADVAKGAVAKLWETHDRVRGLVHPGTDKQVDLTVIDEAAAQAQTEFVREVETLAQRDGGVFSDADLALELGAAAAAVLDKVVEPATEVSEQAGLLDKTIRSNIELAEKFGDLDQHRVLLERKNRELVQIAQNTVHDLNRPLAAIKLFLSSVAKGLFGPVDGLMRTGVDNSLAAAKHMESLIRDLMDSSRLDFDGIKLNFQECDLTHVVADVLRTLRTEIEDADVRLRVEPLPTVKGDAWALTRVFMNLIGNAIQYRHPDREPRVHVFVERRGDGWRLTVADNGIGVPAADVPRLFRRFERGSNTGGVSGSGLGLHIVREVVAGHGGQVAVESKEGEGTNFVIDLPLEPQQQQHSPLADTMVAADA
jgi:signal transduction histidine kinase/signal recognition particle receptor subunit beta